MPHPIVYVGTQDDDRTRSIDLVHIGPSIREGVHLVTSLYGSDASAPLYRYAPANTVAPWISGDVQIPSTLTCNEGQWSSSPSVKFDYQWMSDGIAIPGETNRQYITDASVDGTLISCEVRGYNYLDEAYALTPSIAVSLIEPIELNEQENYIITGLDTDLIQTIHDEKSVIITGMGAENGSSVTRGVLYLSSGTSAFERNDVNSLNLPVITGLSVDQSIPIKGPEVSVINWDTGTLFTNEAVQPLPIKNGTAEAGIAGWTAFGAATHRDVFGGGYEGDIYWWGGANVDASHQNIPYSYLYQDVVVWPVWQSEVDLGNCSIHLEWYQSNSNWEDQGNVKVDFLNAGKVVISSDNGPGLLATQQGVWTLRKMEASVPSGTRYIRVYMEFNLQSGTDNNAYIDFIAGTIFTGTYPVGRDYGPNFSDWRIRFTQANAYSGTSLSEVEFRNGIGGADLAVGGTPIAGSEGLGGLATYAFDDLRDTKYWAGESNGVSNGTAWIGYQFGSTIRPIELDITARTGTESLQVGREFVVEGKAAADSLWTPVQHFEYAEIGNFSSGQQKQFVITSGTLPYTHEQAQIDAGLNVKEITSDTKRNLGNTFTAKTRMDITHLRAYVGAADTFRIGICRLVFFSDWGSMYEYDPFKFEVEVTAGFGNEYIEVALPSTFSTEVGDSFVVYITDVNTTSNCRVGKYTTEAPEDRTYAYRLRSWGSSRIVLIEGTTNENGYGAFYDVDFRGTIF